MQWFRSALSTLGEISVIGRLQLYVAVVVIAIALLLLATAAAAQTIVEGDNRVTVEHYRYYQLRRATPSTGRVHVRAVADLEDGAAVCLRVGGGWWVGEITPPEVEPPPPAAVSSTAVRAAQTDLVRWWTAAPQVNP